MSILCEGDADDALDRLEELELLVEQAADQEDYSSAEYYDIERFKLNEELENWKCGK